MHDFCMQINRIHFDSIDSTNTWAKQNAHTLPKDKITLVTANGQTAGRGRFKRQWESPPEQSIYASFCFFMEKHRHDIGNIPQIMAISAAQTLDELGFHSRLKWPNDVLINEKKVAGILAETTPLSDSLCVVIGIGLNINMPSETAQKIDRPATSLLIESGKEWKVEEILFLLQQQFLKNLHLFLEEGFHGFLGEYRLRMKIDPNQIIRFNDNKTIWEGTIHSIPEDGSLNLQLKSGEIRNFLVGEILWSI